jgi:hypothetical protein
MKRKLSALALVLIAAAASADVLQKIDPPEQGFYAQRMDYEGIPIKASAAVSAQALLAAHDRLFMMLRLIPSAAENLRAQGAELHLIGKDQAPSDLPENLGTKGKPFDGAETIDQRTRGTGGILASCGEENLLKLDRDRYAGRDICVHEFSHALHVYGLSKDIQALITRQYADAMKKGLWKGLYASTNEREYFAELTMWYFGTRGDADKLPQTWRPGPRWLKSYDPEGYDLLDRIYSGALEIRRKKIVPLAKLPPSREKDLRASSGDAVTVIFVNNSSRPVRIYWLDFEGNRKSYGGIPALGRQDQRTFTTHPFLITDENDRGLAVFVAGSEDATATIVDADFSLRPVSSTKQ